MGPKLGLLDCTGAALTKANFFFALGNAAMVTFNQLPIRTDLGRLDINFETHISSKNSLSNFLHKEINKMRSNTV